MENGAIDYLSFVRGFTEALEAEEAGHFGGLPSTGGSESGVDAASYAKGFEAGSQLVPHTLIYRELSIQDGGRFTGTLDLSGAEFLDDSPEDFTKDSNTETFEGTEAFGDVTTFEDTEPFEDAGPWHAPIGQSRTETAPVTYPDEPPFDEPVHLSGTLELG